MTVARDRLVDDVMQAQKQIFQAMHSAAEPAWLQLDLTMGQLKGLFALANEGTLTIGQVAEALSTGKPAASILVDRLVQLDLVERTDDPLDRRRALVRLTARGDELVARLHQGRGDRLRGWLNRLDDDDLTALARGLCALAAMATAERVPVSA